MLPPHLAATSPGSSTAPEVTAMSQQHQMAMLQHMRWMQAMQAQAARASIASPYSLQPGYPGAPDGGLSAAYAAWSAYGGNTSFGGGVGGLGIFGTPFPEKGRGKGKFKGKGKGKGKGKDFKGEGKGAVGREEKNDDEVGEENGECEGEGEIGAGKFTEGSSISQAQRSARLRFEKDIIDRLQGRWLDESEPDTVYTVDGSLCSVASGNGGRVFRNRLSVYGVDLCWDARRFWHYLDLPALYAAGDVPERVEWNPGKDSPPTRCIVWLRAPPEPEPSQADAEAEVVAAEGSAPTAAEGSVAAPPVADQEVTAAAVAEVPAID